MSDALRWAEERAGLLAANHTRAVREMRARMDMLKGGELCATSMEQSAESAVGGHPADIGGGRPGVTGSPERGTKIQPSG